MNGVMKKKAAVILLVIILLMGLSLFWFSGPGTGMQTAETPDVTGARSSRILAVRSHEADRMEDTDRKRIALTFDDGPHPFYTGQLLDGLRERGVQVTFFVTGENAALHPDVIRQMEEDGHLIGNHTYSHMQLRKDNRETFRAELIKTNEILKEITGEDICFVRPPYGSWDKSFEKELSMFPVLWTVDPLDWCSNNASCVTERILGHVKDNDIILMHDCYESTVTAALQVVDTLQAQGYTFVTVEEILFE